VLRERARADDAAAGPATSAVRTPEASTRSTAASTSSAASKSPKLSRSMAASARICAIGFARSVPARSYAAPCPVW
jgi:hypothetical protein